MRVTLLIIFFVSHFSTSQVLAEASSRVTLNTGAVESCVSHVVPTDTWIDGVYIFEEKKCPQKNYYFITNDQGIYKLSLREPCGRASETGVNQLPLYIRVSGRTLKADLINLKRTKDVLLSNFRWVPESNVITNQPMTAEKIDPTPALKKIVTLAVNAKILAIFRQDESSDLLSEAAQFDSEELSDDPSKNGEILSTPLKTRVGRRSHAPHSSTSDVHDLGSEGRHYWREVQSRCSGFLNREICGSLQKMGYPCRKTWWNSSDRV